jgi:hypothetical protein
MVLEEWPLGKDRRPSITVSLSGVVQVTSWNRLNPVVAW